MAYYELGLRTTNVTTSNAALEIIGSNTKRAKLIEIGFTLATAVSTVLGFGRPAAVGVTPVPVLVQAEDPNDAAGVSAGSLSASTSPTAPTIFMRRFGGNAIGQGAIWTFPKGIVMASSGTGRSLVLFNITGGATLDVYFVIDE